MSSRRWLSAVRLILAVQTRAGFPQVYLGIAVLTIAAFRFLIPEQAADILLPVFLLSEQGVVSMTLVAAHLYLERNEGSILALAVTPLRDRDYVAALVAGSSVFACISGMVIWAGVAGFDERVLLLALPLFLMSAVSALLGIGLAARFDEFTSFIVGGATTATVVLSLPLLSYFGVTPRWTFAWLPSHWALEAFSGLLGPYSVGSWLGHSAVLALFCAPLFAVALRSFATHLRHGLGAAK